MSEFQQIEIEEPLVNIIDNLPFKEYNCKGVDNQIYNIKIFISQNSIIFNAKKEDFFEIVYKREYTLNDLYKINIFFKGYSSIDNVFKLFFEKLKEEEIIISQNKKKLIIKFINKNAENDIIFNLNLQIKYEEIIINLCDKIIEVNQLKKKLNEVKEIIQKNKKEMEELILDKIKKSNENNKIEFNNIINKKLNIENKKDIKENKNNILYFIFFYIILLFSIIIYYNSNQKKELERLEKELKSTYIKLQEVYLDLDIVKSFINYYFNGKNSERKNYFNYYKKKGISEDFQIDNIISLTSINTMYTFFYLVEEGIKKNFNKGVKDRKILFKASRDGFNSSDFHKKCDGKDYTVTLILSKDRRLFGGFTDNSWDSISGSKEGNKSFLFSIDNNKVYYNKNYKKNIFCSKYYGPIFGLNDLVISNDCNNNFESYDSSGEAYDTEGKKYALAGYENFSVIDYVVYHIELDDTIYEV